MAREIDRVTAALERTVRLRTGRGRQVTRSWEGTLSDTCDFVLDLDRPAAAWRCRRSESDPSAAVRLSYAVDQRCWTWDADVCRWAELRGCSGPVNSPLAGWMYLLGVDKVHERARLSTGHDRFEVGVSLARAVKGVRRGYRSSVQDQAERDGLGPRMTMWVTIGAEGTLDELEYSGGASGSMFTRQCWLQRLGTSQVLPASPEGLDLHTWERLR